MLSVYELILPFTNSLRQVAIMTTNFQMIKQTYRGQVTHPPSGGAGFELGRLATVSLHCFPLPPISPTFCFAFLSWHSPGLSDLLPKMGVVLHV